MFHWILSLLCFYSKTVERVLKGKTELLYKDGAFNWKIMRRYHLTQEDIMSEIRTNAGLTELKDIRKIFIEDSGEVSIIPKMHVKMQSQAQDNIED